MENIKGKRILMITPFAPPNLGGAETHLEDLYNYLTERGYSVTLLTYQPLTTKAKGLSFEERGNLKIFRFDLYGNNLFHMLEKYHPIFNFSYLTPVLFIRSFLFMFHYHREIDLIHVFGLSASFIARFLRIFFRKPIIMSTEALYNFNIYSLFAIVSRWVLKGFDLILAQSLSSKEDIMRLGISGEKIFVYAHWINLENFKPQNKDEAKALLGWENKFTALYVGRLISQKGIKVFIKTAQLCYKDINFKIVGDDGPELSLVMEASERMNNLEFLGKVNYQDLPKYYAAADVFVYPALYEEDMARVIIEALACGTPVVLSNRGSGVYEISDGVGFVVKAEAPEILDKIYYLYDDPAALRSMSETSVKFVKGFSESCGKVITDSYAKIIFAKK